MPAPRDLAQLAVEYRGIPRPRRVVNDLTPTYSVGHRETFWIGRQNPPSHFQVEADLRYVGRHAYWYVQQDFQVPDAALRESAHVFDTLIYPEVRRIVGSEAFPGIDNDPRITIFHGDLPGVAGYVSSADSYPRSVHPHSNEREMVYLNVRAQEAGSLDYLATLAHELTHLVHWNVNPLEDTWVKEGAAQLVAFLVFPEVGLPSSALSSTADRQLTSWPDVDALSHAGGHYEAASWFLRYLQDRFGEEALAAVLARDAHGTFAVEGFLREVSPPSSFGSLYGDWAAANLVGRRDVPDAWSYRSRAPQAPRARRLGAGERVEQTVAQFGARYYEIVPPRGGSVDFEGATTVSTIAVEPVAGDAMWYAGRADSSIATMTRAFDLSGLEQAALSFWIWHDTEHQYDFVHVSASRDGGRTWELLDGPGMSRTNPTGNNLGVGYTGRSGGGSEPRWIQEVVDLTRYAGRQLLIRFSYVTDDAILREGVALDEIRIDAVDFRDGAEDPQGGWTLEGWARVGGALPQIWALRAIEFDGNNLRVSVLPVDAVGRAQWTSGDRRVDRLVLAIAAATPVTVQRGRFQLSVIP